MDKIYAMCFVAGIVVNLAVQGNSKVTAKSTGDYVWLNGISENEDKDDISIDIDIDTDLLLSDPRLRNTMFYKDDDSSSFNEVPDGVDLVLLVDNNVVSPEEDLNNVDAQHVVVPLADITGKSNLDTGDALTNRNPLQFNGDLMKNIYGVDNSMDNEVNQLDQNKYDTDINVVLNHKPLHVIEMSSSADVGKGNDDKWKYLNEIGSSLDNDYSGMLNSFNVEYFQTFSKTNLDEVMDFVLQLVSNNLIRRKRDQIRISDIHKVFDKKVGNVTVKGTFNALQGYFRNVSTIRRTGDVTVSRVGETLQIECALGLGIMQVGYNHYDVQVQAMSGSGILTGTVGANSISMKVTMAIIGGICKATLNKLKLEQFKDMKVQITGLGPLGDLLTQITNWITEHFQTQIVSIIEKELRKAVMDTLGRFHC